MATNITSDDLKSMLNELRDVPCWHVNAGGGAGSSFSLSLGGKVLRKCTLKNPDVTEEFRKYAGEATLLIWCSWRLDGDDEAEASSDESPDVAAGKLHQLAGQFVRRIETTGGAHDLRIVFDTASLVVFCDHVPGDPSFDGNWQLEYQGRLVMVGPGFVVRED